ncbi:hypothetical protein ASF41_11800 [Methylobacterium sp. Leaf111]|nr:hypothetical protein ASF41_11800 [Methylobacterium sp. Leaf111]
MKRGARETDMDIQTPLAAAIVVELKCRAEASEQDHRVEAGEPGYLTIDGRINRGEPIMGIEGAPAGGP